MNAACAVCRTTTEPLTASGLCGTCQSQASETKPAPPDEFAPTVSREPALDTHSADSGTPTESPLPPGGYELLENIGVGGMGQVWRARRLSTRQIVAIKKLLPERFSAAGFKRFAAEAKAVAQVDHKNVVRLLDFVPDPADPFLVLEFVDGQNLTEHVKQARQFNPRRAARLLADACAGIQAANDKGIVHRDLKPGNILLTADGVVKITDFGLVKSILDPTDGPTAGPDDADALDTLTRTGQSAGGTPGFMAPEQADVSFADIDRRTDVYGLGATLFALLLGRAPFPGGKENMRRVFTDPVPVPHDLDPQVPRDLSLIVVKCLQKRPADRYPTAAALAADLTAYLNGDSTTVNPHGWARRQWRRAGKLNRGWWVAAGLLLLTVGTGIGLAMVPKPPPVVVAAPPTTPTPQEVQAKQRERFLAGEEVVLVPEKGLPEWHEWVVGKADISESPSGDGAAYISPASLGAVKLFEPPGDSYRVRFDLKHLNAHDTTERELTSVGIFLFHYRRSGATGQWADSIFLTRFRDWDLGWMDGLLPAQQPVTVRIWHKFSADPNSRAILGESKLNTAFGFDTGRTPPGPWRRVVAEVTPAGVRLYWADDATDPATKLRLVREFTAKELNAKYASYHESETFLAVQPIQPSSGRVSSEPALLPKQWDPTGGFGLWAMKSELAFRNLTVQSLPPSKE
ncbi:MAG: serine/threonine-protein kinase [Armatimonadaceae bacterium]